MQFTFRINADSEAVLTAKSRRILLEQGDIVALDWVLDMHREVTALYNELHEIVFPVASAYVAPDPGNDPDIGGIC